MGNPGILSLILFFSHDWYNLLKAIVDAIRTADLRCRKRLFYKTEPTPRPKEDRKIILFIFRCIIDLIKSRTDFQRSYQQQIKKCFFSFSRPARDGEKKTNSRIPVAGELRQNVAECPGSSSNFHVKLYISPENRS